MNHVYTGYRHEIEYWYQFYMFPTGLILSPSDTVDMMYVLQGDIVIHDMNTLPVKKYLDPYIQRMRIQGRVAYIHYRMEQVVWLNPKPYKVRIVNDRGLLEIPSRQEQAYRAAEEKFSKHRYKPKPQKVTIEVISSTVIAVNATRMPLQSL